MSNVSKVVYGGKTLIDLTGDTVKPDKLLNGYTAHGADGKSIYGTCTYDANTQSATASSDDILDGETAYVRGSRITGKMKNNGAVAGKIQYASSVYTIPAGYHDGSGTVGIVDTEKAKLVPENIRAGVTVLGVQGKLNVSGEAGEITVQEKTVTPKTSEQIVVPDSGYDGLSSVTVLPIPYVEATNSAGGLTVTIG